MNTDRCVRTAPLVAMAVLLLAASRVADALPVTVGVGTWRLEGGGIEASGCALWFLDGSGSWRCDVGVSGADSVTVADLRQRVGRGWTLAAPWDGALLTEAWGEPWREAGRELADVISVLLDRWSQSASPPFAPAQAFGVWTRPSRRQTTTEIVNVDDLPAAWRPPDLRRTEGNATHRAMVTRGLGRGGQGMRVEITDLPEGGLRLVTARWPGALILEAPRLASAAALPPEAFLPVWSVAELGLAADVAD
jgi:hypothetical protein